MGLNNSIFTNESPGLFNGNIAAMMTDIKILATEEDPNVSIYGYVYDQLHRIKRATNYRAVGMGYEGTNMYNTNYSYDPDGNLTNLQRGGQEENNVMDRLSYVYGASSRPNQLTQVNDLASDGTPGQFSGTEGYVYDQIGNLTETTSNGNLTKIDWDVYNKVKQVTNEDLLTRYLYDGAGNRVLTFKNVGFEDRRPVITGYSRDASGNTLAVYDASDGESYPYGHPLEEMYVFGSSRIGVDKTLRTDDRNPGIFIYHKDLTTTRYEITNHLGNVLTTVTGRKLGQGQEGVVDFYLPEVVTATDYYAFGAQMPGRSYENTTLSGTNGYRYAFNGKEHDSDGEFGSLTHYDYGFRIYNLAIAKFLSVDPLTASYPWYTPYQFAGNKPIWAIDLDGLEEFKVTDVDGNEKSVFGPYRNGEAAQDAEYDRTSFAEFLTPIEITASKYDVPQIRQGPLPVKSLSDKIPIWSWQAKLMAPIVERQIEVINYLIQSPIAGRGEPIYKVFDEGYTIEGSDESQNLAVEGMLTFSPLLGRGFVQATKGGNILLNASEKYVVIGKYPDYINFASKYKNASVLDLPNKWAHLPKQEAAKFLWKQNSSQLRGALRNGYIPYDIGYGGKFYNAEKLILGNKGLSLHGKIWIK